MNRKIQRGLYCILLSLLFTPSFSDADNTKIGADTKQVIPTSITKATKYVSPYGKGHSCTPNAPCSLYTVVDTLVPGDVVFLREGVYHLHKRLKIQHTHSGTSQHPVTIESYPHEKVIIDTNTTIQDIKTSKSKITIFIKGNYIHLRNIEIKNMPQAGLIIGGSHNIIEGCNIHHNHLSGIQILDSIQFNKTPYVSGYNLIQNNIIHDNSDVGLDFDGYKNGGNADGIAISSGIGNKIFHNTVYNNSDDGIDTWLSNNTEVSYNLVYNNGLGKGDGCGIKSGGNLNPKAQNGLGANIHHNISFHNKSFGFNLNAGKEVVWSFNTAYQNREKGFGNLKKNDITLFNNLSIKNGQDEDKNFANKNSWQYQEPIKIISVDTNSTQFLKPFTDTLYTKMGAYSD